MKLPGGVYPEAALLAAVSLAAAAAMVLARDTQWAFVLTAVASLGFVLSAIAGRPWRHAFGRFMVLGLVLCCIGDLVGVHDFSKGAMAFLLAHLAFISAFVVQGIQWRELSPFLLLTALGAGLGLAGWLLPQVPPGEQWLVIFYIVVILTMTVLSAGVRPFPCRPLLVAAAILFLVSDIFVARWKYVSPSDVNAYFCFPLYYSACVLFALSVSVRTHSS